MTQETQANHDIDLLVTDNDLTLKAGEPQRLSRRAVIEQDIKHMIREQGLAVRMVGNRNAVEVAYLAQRIELAMENDTRLIPGTAVVAEVGSGQFLATANTVYGDTIQLGVGMEGG